MFGVSKRLWKLSSDFSHRAVFSAIKITCFSSPTSSSPSPRGTVPHACQEESSCTRWVAPAGPARHPLSSLPADPSSPQNLQAPGLLSRLAAGLGLCPAACPLRPSPSSGRTPSCPPQDGSGTVSCRPVAQGPEFVQRDQQPSDREGAQLPARSRGSGTASLAARSPSPSPA